ncbi:hypothetical protein BRADI_4g28302v3 [Brachypodium distachyon]|uniref:Uncharacterized protein n=1 Tax=Brachypodium distachyon TaxID=15368 RepID=A0A2K2CQY8_BRADI|nr:hypothetical protein BRADI_4g28302v3 [Brachypodium distachyon]
MDKQDLICPSTSYVIWYLWFCWIRRVPSKVPSGFKDSTGQQQRLQFLSSYRLFQKVITILVFTDYICPKLKARCFDFLAEGENFKIVATSA